MPRTTKSEPTKKHGDKMEPLIEKTERDRGQRDDTRSGDDPAALQDDDDEDIENDNAEDIENDDADDRRDVGE